MLSRPVSRAAYNPQSFTITTGCLRSSTSGSLLLGGRPQHRRSSSKSSHPPGGNHPSARSSAQAGSSSNRTRNVAAERSDGDPSQERRRSSTNGGSRRRSRTYALGEELSRQNDAFNNVPAVQPTSHLNLADVKLSSLFALHRPISINPSAAYPPATSDKTFNAIFAPPKHSKISDEIYTVAPSGSPSSVYQTEEADGLHFSVLQNSPSNATSSSTHIDNEALPSLETLARQFRPFQKPPAPVPLGDESQSSEMDAWSSSPSTVMSNKLQSASMKASAAPRQSGRTYTTTLTIAEAATALDGGKSYSVNFSPLVEDHASNPNLSPKNTRRTSSRQPFLSRMYSRNGTDKSPHQDRATTPAVTSDKVAELGLGDLEYIRDQSDTNETLDGFGRDMLLISVKRQRKLKMKKHKYKKLMRRTRNLRRRQGRL